MDNEQKFIDLISKLKTEFYKAGTQGAELKMFPGWTPEATPEEEAECKRAIIKQYKEEYGIAESSAEVTALLTIVADIAMYAYRDGATKAPVKAATSTRAGT